MGLQCLIVPEPHISHFTVHVTGGGAILDDCLVAGPARAIMEMIMYD